MVHKVFTSAVYMPIKEEDIRNRFVYVSYKKLLEEKDKLEKNKIKNEE